MVHDPPYWEGIGRISPQGGPQADGEETSEREGRHVGIPPAGGRYDGGGTVGGGDLRLPPPEHSITVYCSQAHYGPVSGGRAETGANGIQVVVVIVRGGCGGDVNVDSGCGTDRKGGRRQTGRRQRQI